MAPEKQPSPASLLIGQASRVANAGGSSTPPSMLDGLTVRIRAVPASKARDVVKVAVLPLSAASAEMTIDVTIHADSGLAGTPRDTLNLVVLEGLRQLGLTGLDVVES